MAADQLRQELRELKQRDESSNVDVSSFDVL